MIEFPELEYAGSVTSLISLYVDVLIKIQNNTDQNLTTNLKTCLWNPGTYRHKIVRLSIAQFGLVMF